MKNSLQVNNLIEQIAEKCSLRKESSGMVICFSSKLSCLRTIEAGKCAKLKEISK